jgi:hypothetical protein
MLNNDQQLGYCMKYEPCNQISNNFDYPEDLSSKKLHGVQINLQNEKKGKNTYKAYFPEKLNYR